MGKKMYYTEAETARALGKTVEELANLVRDDRLRVFQDGDKKMFKVEEVDMLSGAGERTQMEGDALAAEQTVLAAEGESGLAELEDEIELTPADSRIGEAATLVDADGPLASGKEDTVITAEGISIFDEEDLEIEAADPLAKTQIAPSMEDQIAIEGVGSGSGLLDLTRESDDTSLGAEVLDHIDEMEGAAGSGIAAAQEVAAEVATMPEITYIEPAGDELDASSGLFGGIAIGTAIVTVLLAGTMLSVMTGKLPSYLQELRNNIMAVLLGGVFVVGLSGVIGLMVGKSTAVRQAMQQQQQ